MPQNSSRAPSLIWRSPKDVVICPNAPLVMPPAGSLKCIELDGLNAEAMKLNR